MNNEQEKNLFNSLLEHLDREYLKKREGKELSINPLYHYTSAKGLKGILKTKYLHLSHYKKLSDTSEFRYAGKIIKKLLGLHGHGVYELIKMSQVYTISFCEKRDYLLAGIAHANDGEGFSIGFKPEFINKNTKEQEFPTEPHYSVFFGKVYYGKEIIHSEYEKIKSITPIHDFFNQITPDTCDIYYSSLGGCLARYSPFFKHLAFAGEKERRCVAWEIPKHGGVKIPPQERQRIFSFQPDTSPRFSLALDMNLHKLNGNWKNCLMNWATEIFRFHNLKFPIKITLTIKSV